MAALVACKFASIRMGLDLSRLRRSIAVHFAQIGNIVWLPRRIRRKAAAARRARWLIRHSGGGKLKTFARKSMSTMCRP